MADVNISKYRASVVRDGSKPASPGFVVSEGQDPVNPPGTNNYVPYTGATANVELGEFGIEAGFVTLDITPTNIPTDQGAIYWDDTRSTAALIMNGTLQHIGQDSFFYVKNSSGSTIPKGTCVGFAGTDGGSGHLLITPFLADGSVPSTYFMGVTSEAIANGAFGQVMHFGELTGINTSGFTAGALLYASSTVAGAFQTTAPVAPNNIILVAAAVNSKNNGAIVVRPTLGSNINSDEGVKITSPTTGDLLQLQAGGLWENKTLAQVIGSAYVPSTRTLTINGTAFDLSANRSWIVGDVRTDGSYSNPSWITALAWSKITGTPTTLSGYGITDAVPSSRTITINGTTQDLSANRSFNVGTVTSVGLSSATSGVTIGGSPVTGVGAFTLTIATASGSQQGLLSASDWTTFNNKQNALTNPVTGTGASGQVAYFNGTTSITSESSLFWDATNDRLGIGITNPFGMFHAKSAGAYGAVLSDNTGTTGGGYFASLQNGSTRGIIAVTGAIEGNTTSDFGMFAETGGALRFYVNGSATRVMSLTSGGNLIVGTTSDNGERLQVNGEITAVTRIRINKTTQTNQLFGDGNAFTGGTSGDLGIRNDSGRILFASGGGTIQMLLNSAGNLGLGVTPSTWFSTVKAIDISTATALWAGGNGQPALGYNVFVNTSGNLIYKTSEFASRYEQISGQHQWFTAPSGTAGNAISFTQAMTLTSGGNLLVGTTSDNGARLQVSGAATFSSSVTAGGGKSQFVASGGASSGAGISLNTGLSGTDRRNWFIGTEETVAGDFTIKCSTAAGGNANAGDTRLAILNNGNVGIGTTSPNAPLHVVNSSNGFIQRFSGGTSSAITGGIFAEIGRNFASIGTTSNHAFSIFTNDTDRLFITSGGNVLIGTTTDGGYKLDVNGTGRFTSNLYTSTALYINTTAAYGFRINSEGNNGFYNRGGSTAAHYPFLLENSSGALLFQVQGTGAATFSSSVTASGPITMAYGGIPRLTLQDTDAGSGNVGILFKEGTNDRWALASVGGAFQFFNETISSNAIFITSGNNVGIGTSSPSARLHVGESGAAAQLWLQRTDGYNPVKLIGGTLSDGNGFKITMNTTDAFAITSGGNVGIGTGSPTFRLDVQNNTQAIARVLDTSTNASLILQAGSGSAMKVTAYNYASSTALPLYIQVDGANTIMQSGGGNVLIGTTTDVGARLHVNGDVRTAAPTGGSAVNWRLGTARAGTITPNATVRVEIGGVLVDLDARYV